MDPASVDRTEQDRAQKAFDFIAYNAMHDPLMRRQTNSHLVRAVEKSDVIAYGLPLLPEEARGDIHPDYYHPVSGHQL